MKRPSGLLRALLGGLAYCLGGAVGLVVQRLAHPPRKAGPPAQAVPPAQTPPPVNRVVINTLLAAGFHPRDARRAASHPEVVALAWQPLERQMEVALRVLTHRDDAS